MKINLIGLLFVLIFTGCATLQMDKNITFVEKEYILQNETKDSKITLGFTADNFFGYAGVNRYFGKYTVEANTIKIDNVGRTMMMGRPEFMKVEDAYLKELKNIKSFKFDGDMLIITTSDDSELKFKEQKKSDSKE